MEPNWRRSSFSGGHEDDNCVEVWRRSTHDGGNDDRIEASPTPSPIVAVRDSKHPASVVHLPLSAWDFLLRELS